MMDWVTSQPTCLDKKSHNLSTRVSCRAINANVIYLLSSMWHVLRLLSAKQGVEASKNHPLRVGPQVFANTPQWTQKSNLGHQGWSHGSPNGHNVSLCSNVEGFQGGTSPPMSQGVRPSSYGPLINCHPSQSAKANWGHVRSRCIIPKSHQM